MNKITKLFALLLIAGTMFIGCRSEDPIVAVTSVTLNNNELTLFVGGTAELTHTIAPGDATNQNVTWTSNNHNAATVADNGLVTAHAPGEAIITVTTECGNRTATATVTVTPEPSPIVIEDDEELEQTLYADEEESESGINFTTTAPWVATVSTPPTTSAAGTVRNAADWVTIYPESGGAGTHTIQITLETNFTREDRTATITISSGGIDIRITVMQRGVTEDGYVPTPPAETVTEIRAENIGGDDSREVATVKATVRYWDGVEDRHFTVAETPFQNNGFTLQLNSVPNNFLQLIQEDAEWFDSFTISDEDARWGILFTDGGVSAYDKNGRRIGSFTFMEEKDNVFNATTWIYSDRDVVITASHRSEWYDSLYFSQSSFTQGITRGTLRGTNHRATSTRSGSRVWEETWDLNLGQGWNIVYISDIWTETSEKITLTSQKPDDMNLRWIFSSWEDGRPPEDAISRVSQFVYDGMAMFYLWNEQMLDREPTAHDTDPKAYFNSLLYRLDRERQWSWITDDVNSLLNSFSGTATGSLGLAPIFLWLPNGIHLVGAVRYVYQGTAAYEVGIRRGDIITEIDGRPITLTNAPLLLEGNARITLTVFDQNFENRREVIITPRPFQANPVLHSSIHEIEGRRIGYLFYTAFRSNFNEELFEVFRKFQQAGITDLVLDLRYNSGGDISAAAYLASMIAPRIAVENQSVFTIINYNRFINEVFDRQGTDRSMRLGTFNNRFSNPIDANLNLDNVFIIATRSSASASELITFCLRPHMNVVHIGELTSGKYTASWTVHAFDNFTEHGVARAQRVYDEADLTAAEKDKLRNWAMQPIVAEFQNARNETFAATNGLIPDHPIAWLGNAPHTWRQIGDREDHLFAKAISLITGLPYVETPLRSASDIQLRSTELRSSAEERLRRAVNLDSVEPVDPEILRQILLDFEF